MASPTLFDTSEAARRLGVSVFTIRRLARRGALRPVRFGGTGHMRFRVEDVERLIERERVKP